MSRIFIKVGPARWGAGNTPVSAVFAIVGVKNGVST